MSKVTVVGAGRYGSTAAQRLAETGLVDEVVITDVVEGLPQGLALDMNQSRYLERHPTRVIGTNDFEEALGGAIGAGTVTYDFARLMTGATEVRTSGFADAIIARL